MRIGQFIGVALLTTISRPLLAQADALTPQELHDRIVTLMRTASRPLPAGDTLISWYKRPILFHLVHREPTRIAEGMMRGDGLLGTAQVELRDTRPTAATISWTQTDSAPVDLQLQVRGDSVIMTGTRQGAWLVPSGPWAIADYGMEDLSLPAVLTLRPSPGTQSISIYRPFAAHWDTLTLTSRTAVGDGVLLELRGSDGKRDWWLANANGAIVQMRREGQDFERRPLETTGLMSDYRRLVALLPH